MNWFVTGVNYKKANLEQRQKYSLSADEVVTAYDNLKALGIKNALIISTCNRTEFFLPLSYKDEAAHILSKYIYKRDIENALFHFKTGKEAVKYFFRICSGLESQIPGDFEILGQVRKNFLLAKNQGVLSGVWERMINSGLHSAKKARTQTNFFSGASSTSYACIEYLKKINFDFKNGSFLLIGTGKIGKHTLDHLLKIVDHKSITLSNRSPEKAEALSTKNDLSFLPFEALSKEVKNYKVIICATNAPDYIITEEMLNGGITEILIDLSVPLNIDPAIKENKNFTLLNVDQLSKIVNENLEKRKSESDKVENIIDEEILELGNWFTISNGMPLLAELKGELEQLKVDALSKIENAGHPDSKAFLDQYTDELFDQLSQQWIKKVRNRVVDVE